MGRSVSVIGFVHELAIRHPPTDIGLPGEPQLIYIVSDACPTLRAAFDAWHGSESCPEAVVWAPSATWVAFVEALDT